MNDGTMEYSIKTGASLDDLQTLKQNLNFSDENPPVYRGRSEYCGKPFSQYFNTWFIERRYIQLVTGTISNTQNASIQFIIDSECDIAVQKKDMYLITFSTRGFVTCNVLRLSGKTDAFNPPKFWYYTDNDNIVHFGIFSDRYDDYAHLIKLSDSTNLHYDIQLLGNENNPPSENLQYAKIHEVVTTEGSTMFGSLMHDEEEWFNIYGGPKSTQSSGILQLGNENGRFNLIAKTIGDTTQNSEMCGYPDGRLTWNGNDLAGNAIVAKNIAMNGYIQYATGLVIQWGITSIPENNIVYYPLVMNTTYSINTTFFGNQDNVFDTKLLVWDVQNNHFKVKYTDTTIKHSFAYTVIGFKAV